jgi:predicted PurR-regulated permease PerM
MAQSPASSVAFRTITALAALVVVIAGMWAAEEVILPVLFAVLLSIVSAPMVLWLERRRIPAWIAVLLVVLLVMGILAVFGTVLAASVGEFSQAIPRYKARLDVSLETVNTWISSLGYELSYDQLAKIEPGTWMDTLGATLSGLIDALTNTALVVLTMIFILLEIAEMPRKLRAAFHDPGRALGRARRMVIEVQRYLVIKTLISAITGVLVGVWTWVLGVDFPLLWGFVGFALNYIPNVGSIIAAAPPMAVALVQLGPGHMILVGAGYTVVNMLLGNLLEPQWMGRQLGLSPLVVFLSLLFWGGLWGSVGMLLSVPLTMVIKISFEQSDDFRWIAILLSGAPDIEDQRFREGKALPLAKGPVMNAARSTANGEIFTKPAVTVADEARD